MKTNREYNELKEQIREQERIIRRKDDKIRDLESELQGGKMGDWCNGCKYVGWANIEYGDTNDDIYTKTVSKSIMYCRKHIDVMCKEFEAADSDDKSQGMGFEVPCL